MGGTTQATVNMVRATYKRECQAQQFKRSSASFPLTNTALVSVLYSIHVAAIYMHCHLSLPLAHFISAYVKVVSTLKSWVSVIIALTGCVAGFSSNQILAVYEGMRSLLSPNDRL